MFSSKSASCQVAYVSGYIMLIHGLTLLQICLFQMPSEPVVRHTHCMGVAGFPFLLATAAANIGSPYFPVYSVHEQYLDFNQIGRASCRERVCLYV